MSASQQNRKSFLAAFHLAGQSIVLNVISVPAIAYTIRRLHEDGFGQWSTATELVAAVAILTNLGLRGTFVRSVARDSQNAGRDLAEQLGVRMLLCFLSAAVAMTVCLLLGYPKVVIQCAAVASIGTFFVTFASTLSDLLQGVHRISIYAAANFIAGALVTAAGVIVVWRWPGPVTLSVAYLVAPAATMVLLLHYVHTRMFPVRFAWTPRRWLQLLKSSHQMALQQFVNTLSLKAEALLLPPLVGPAMFGLFSAGSLLQNRLGVISDGLGSAFYPVIAQSMARDPKAASRDVGKYLLMAVAVCLPVAVAVNFFSWPVAHILFSKSSVVSKNADICQQVIRITIWALPLMGLESMIGYALNAAGKEGLVTRYASYAVTISLPLVVVLVMSFGIVGACYSLVSRIAIRIIFLSIPFMKTFAPPIPVVRFAKVMACGLGMAISMWFVHRQAPNINNMAPGEGKIRHWAMLLTFMSVEGIVGVLAYGLGLYSLRIVSADDLLHFLKRRKQPVPAVEAQNVAELRLEETAKLSKELSGETVELAKAS
jgi:O-antigen/teichoic acid export membrane protein